MKGLTRRDFLKRGVAAGAGLGVSSVAQAYPFSRVRGANGDIRVAVIGLGSTVSFGGKGRQHIEIFRQIDGVRIVALCDADRSILAAEAGKFSGRKENVDTHVDLRDVLERKDVDAVVTATPNHWHALITVWACQAGKDVYVEKPVSHNIWEGRKMVEAARKYGSIVQAGTQSRSDEALREVFNYIREGSLGKILVARGFCYKRRLSIGKVECPQPIPDSVDYDLWSGPAAVAPLMRKNLHYDWHWQWVTGNGDIGNQGIHELDICRWALGENKLAPRALSIGGRFGYDDDGETANTQIVFLDYEPVPIIFEVRGLPRKTGDAAMDMYRSVRIGVVIECEGGCFAGGAGGGWAYDSKGVRIRQFKGSGGAGHQANFINAVRSRKISDLNADIEGGHISSALCHMGNISYRIGEQSAPGEIRAAVKSDKDVMETFGRFCEHLAANGVDLSKTPAVLGSCLTMGTAGEKFVGSRSEEANKLIKGKYREPFVVPEIV